MECLDDNAVIAYVERILPEAERRQVAAHLDECEACLAITCAVARSTEAPGATAAPVELQRGAAIGRYALVEMIGRGAMGSVYIAHDPQLDRKVALKIVRSERFAQHDVRARLSREARAMAKVTHPHVVTVYDAGELDDGVFIAMELVSGDTLARWLAAEDRAWRDVVRMFVAIGRGLAAAHAAGIVHRDFKPENVLVDEHGRAAVTDFGLAVAPARQVDPAEDVDGVALADTHELTRTGALVGTPRYMSPEQFRGGAVDARTDQFSFAVALYDALYHQLPFAGVTVGELRAAVTAGALRDRPAPTAVPLRVHQVLVRALAADPADRHASIDRLLDRLVDALEAAARPTRGRQIGFGLAGCLLIVAVAGTIALTRDRGTRAAPVAASPAAALAAQLPQKPDATRIRVLVDRFANQTGDPRLDDTLDLIVADVLFRSTRLDPQVGFELPLEGTTVDALAGRLGEAGQLALALHGSITRDGTPDGAGYVVSLDTRGSQRTTFAATEHATTFAEIAAAAARLGARFLVAIGESPGPIDHVLSPSLDALHEYIQGQRFSFAGEFDKAIAPYRRALAADPDFVDAHQSLGLVLYNRSELPAAIAELERAKQGADRLPDRKRLMLLGDYFGTVGNYTNAIMTYEQLLARWPGDARIEINITATAIDASSWEVALEQARRAAKDHPELVVVRGNLVIAELANGRFDDAARDGATMLADIRQPLSSAVAAVASAQALLGRGQDARATYDKLEALEQAELADEGRADLALYEGRLDDALALLRKYVDPALPRDKTAETSREFVMLASTCLRRGDRAGAARAARSAMGSGDVRLEYMAAAVATEAGDATGAEAKVSAWASNPLPEWRLYGKLLAGDLARARNHPRDTLAAIAAYRDASLIGPSWMIHDRLGRAYLAAGAWAEAERELTWCLDHRGEAAVFMTPSLLYLPEVMLARAQSLDGRHADPTERRAAYQAVLALAPDAQHDPITDEARRQVAKLARLAP